ncbi:hypothetical protein ACMFMF_005347 [Clarireedia jacksonii]
MSAFPPHKSVPSIPVSQDIALKYLQDYLSLTSSTPYLLPNAKLEPTGPTTGSSHSSVTLHNLQRVEAGLRGEWLAPTLELEEGQGVEVAKGMDDGTQQGSGQGDHMDVDGWQDREEFQRQQEIDDGELNATLQATEMDSDLDVDPTAPAPTETAPTETKGISKSEKERRKADKKAKKKAEQREKEMRRHGLADK